MIYINNSAALNFIEESLKEGTTVKLTVRGNSMFPALADGIDVVSLTPVHLHRAPECGDVILFKHKQTFILHRIVEIKESGEVITKGDALKSYEVVMPNHILAVAHYKRHHSFTLFLRRVMRFANKIVKKLFINSHFFTTFS